MKIKTDAPMNTKVPPYASMTSSQKAANGGNEVPLPSGQLEDSGIAGSVKPASFNTGAGGTISPGPGPKKKGSDYLGSSDSSAGPYNRNADN